MTGSSAAGPVRLILREPPHLPFIQGWPGVPGTESRPAATVQGAVEVRVGQPVKAKWVRVEIRKYEAVGNAAVAKSAFTNSWEHVGKVHLLWRAAEGKEYDLLSTADFRFVIPLPLDLPPSVELSKGSGIRYELVASVCYKGKGGLFKKDTSTITTANQGLRIVKYDLASAWPKWNMAEQRTTTAAGGQLTLVVDRNTCAFGPGDRMLITATVKSMVPQAFKVKTIELVLTEILTVHPPLPDPNAKASKKAKPPAPPSVKRSQVAQTRTNVGEFIGPGTETKGSLDLVVPTDRPLLTVKAKDFSLEYELSVEASVECNPGKIAVVGIPCIIGTFSRSSAQQAVKDIGYVELFCPRPQFGRQDSAANPTPLTPGSGTLSPHRPSPSLGAGSSGFLSADMGSGGSGNRPSSMQPPPQSPSPGPQQRTNSPPSSPPQVQGFTPSKDWRRSSSGTTATSASLATDHGPSGYFDHSNRGGALTLPNRRASHSPNINGSSAGRSPEMGSRSTFDDNQMGGSLRAPHRQSSQSGNSFGAWNSSVYECIVDNEDSRGTPVASNSGHSRAPSRDSSASHLSADTARAPQSSQSPGLPDIADEAHHQGLPPEYAPPSKPNQAAGPSSGLSSQNRGMSQEYMNAQQEKENQRRRYEEAQSRVNAGPSGVNGHGEGSGAGASGSGRMGSPTVNSSNRAKPTASAHGHTDDPIPYDQIFGGGPSGSSNSPVNKPKQFNIARKPVQPLYPVEEPKQSPKPESPKIEPPVEVAPKVEAPVQPPQQQSPAQPSQSQQLQPPQEQRKKPQLSAADEKDRMRQRYEQAQAAVARNQAAYDSPGGYSDEEPDPERMGSAPAPLTAIPLGMQAGLNPGMQSVLPAAFQQAARQASSSTPVAGSSSAPPPLAATPAYMSAAEEKEAMRKRYEAAQNNVAAAQRAPAPEMDSPARASNAQRTESPRNVSSASVSSPPAAYMSAAEEKEAMRRRYEQAQQAVARHNSPSPPPASPPPQAIASASSSRAPPAMAAAYMSAAEEKEMMRKRYEEATTRVARATSGSPVPERISTATPDLQPASQFTPLKTPIVGAPLSYDEIFGLGPSNGPVPARAGGSSAAGPSSSAAKPVPAAYMSAAQEKEMMRKRYEEAQNAVARAQAGDSPVRASPGPASSSSPTPAPGEEPIPYDAIFGPGPSGPSSASRAGPASAGPGPSSAAPYLSAEQEKEQMRRRYEEAQSRVARAAGSASPPPSQYAASPTSMSQAAGSSAPPSASGPAGYMSAEQEKDLMRQRYEAASGAVRNAQSLNSRGGAAGSSSPSPSSPAASSSGRFGTPPLRSATDFAPAHNTSGSVSHRSALRSMTTLPDGPPPPLAPRPPREYIERI